MKNIRFLVLRKSCFSFAPILLHTRLRGKVRKKTGTLVEEEEAEEETNMAVAAIERKKCRARRITTEREEEKRWDEFLGWRRLGRRRRSNQRQTLLIKILRLSLSFSELIFRGREAAKKFAEKKESLSQNHKLETCIGREGKYLHHPDPKTGCQQCRTSRGKTTFLEVDLRRSGARGGGGGGGSRDDIGTLRRQKSKTEIRQRMPLRNKDFE